MRQVRLGVLIPTANYVIEPDMYQMAPEGVTVHFGRFRLPSKIKYEDIDPTDQSAYEAHYEEYGEVIFEAAQELARIQPKVIAFGCTSGSFFKGIDYDKSLIKKMEAGAGVPAITTSTAAVQALGELGLKKICLIAPYPYWVVEEAKDFLEANGFEVPIAKGLGLNAIQTAEQPPEVVHKLAVSAYSINCDGIYCACTAFRAVEAIEKVETDLGKPMISANQATMWLMLKIAGPRKPLTGFGELMRHL